MGFITEIRQAQAQKPTNKLSFGRNVDLGTVKLIAKALVQQPGVTITVIDPL